MSDIYGAVTEHPEYPIEDPRRFTVQIKLHDFESTKRRRDPAAHWFCDRCGFSKVAPVHRKEATDANL